MFRNLSRRGVLVGIGLLLLAIVFCFFYFDFPLFLAKAPSGMDENIRFQMEKAKFPGAAAAVVRDGKIIFSKGYGMANIAENRSVDSKTLFTVASVSKPVTAAALMRLFDQGKIKLDDDINAFLPFSVRNPRFPDTPITYRMLLAHTSSIEDAPIYDASYTLNLTGKPEDSPVKLGEFLSDYLPNSGLYFSADKNYTENKPGTKYEYSNVAYGLVGFLVERISKESFDKFCQREVFDFLEMNSTKWFIREIDKSRMAMPYSYNWFIHRYDPVGFYGFPTYPDGGLKTSVMDYARFMAIFMNDGKTPDGKTFLKQRTVQEMLTVQYPQASESAGIAWEKDDAGYSHGGADPGEFTFVHFSPETRTGFIIFTNGDSGDTDLLALTAKGFVESVAKSLASLVN